MSQKSVIRKGDTTSHGGVVLEGIDNYPVMGVPISCKGHMVSCPKCKGVYPIVEGISYAPVEGKYPALEGMKTGCGAVLIASQSVFTYEWVSGYSSVSALISDMRPLESQLQVTDIWFSYGPDEVRLADESRFYVDMNLHAETINFHPGEVIEMSVEYGDEEFSIYEAVDEDGKIKIVNFLKNKNFAVEKG